MKHMGTILLRTYSAVHGACKERVTRGAWLRADARLQCGESGSGLLCAWLNTGNEAWLRREERSVSAGCAWPSCSYATGADG